VECIEVLKICFSNRYDLDHYYEASRSPGKSKLSVNTSSMRLNFESAVISDPKAMQVYIQSSVPQIIKLLEIYIVDSSNRKDKFPCERITNQNDAF
jgi:hypothetical protein